MNIQQVHITLYERWVTIETKTNAINSTNKLECRSNSSVCFTARPFVLFKQMRSKLASLRRLLH